MQLDDAYDDNNIFAKILRGDMPCIKVYEDDATLAFMDIMPQAPGHVPVIPKEAATNFLTLSPAAAQATISTAHRLAPAVQRAVNAPGFMLAQLNGSAAGQTVPHYHLHIIPRQNGLEMALHAREMADMDALSELAEKIRAEL